MGLQLGQAAFGSAVEVMAAGKACGCHRGVSYWDMPAEALGWSREGQTWPQHNPPTHSSLPSISQCWSDKSNHLTARAPSEAAGPSTQIRGACRTPCTGALSSAALFQSSAAAKHGSHRHKGGTHKPQRMSSLSTAPVGAALCSWPGTVF